MYQVSQEYLDKLFSLGKKTRRIRGSINGVTFTENDVLAESLSYSKQMTSSDVTLGGVYVSQLNITFLHSFARRVERGSWKNREIDIRIGLLIDVDEETEEETWEDIPIGVYFVDEANHVAEGVSITAYDAMSRLDKKVTISSTGGSIYSLISLACNQCGITFGMTQEATEDLPNGTETFTMYPDSDIKTWRDFVSWIAVTIGGYATINREGNLELRNWKTETDITLGINDRFTGGSYSDFESFYSGLYYTDIATKTTRYIAGSGTGGLTMNIGANPFMQYGLRPYLDWLAHNIVNAIDDVRWTPFRVTSHIDPILDLGDIVEFTDGLAGTSSICCIMKLDYSYRRGVTMEGFGKNPALIGAQSKTDKNIEGLLSQSTENQNVFLKYANAESIHMGCDSEGVHYPAVNTQLIGSLFVSPIKDTNIEIHTRVIMTQGSEDYIQSATRISNNYRLALIYKMDNVEIARIPFSENDIFTDLDNHARPQTIEDFHSYIGLESGNRKTLDVYLELTQVDGVDGWCPVIDIGQEGVQLTIIGQGLSTEEEWDGIIRCSDVLEGFRIEDIGLVQIYDSKNISLVSVITETITEIIPMEAINSLDISAISESFNIYLLHELYSLVTEDGEYEIWTEDGQDRIMI